MVQKTETTLGQLRFKIVKFVEGPEPEWVKDSLLKQIVNTKRFNLKTPA